jgi:ATP-binding cassette subfamily B protein
VGENGSGKTTLIKLLGRMYDPTRGRLLYDGLDARRFKILDLRGQLSVIFQDFGEYPFSARDNVWFGDIGQSPQSPAVLKALQRAGAGPLMGRLPDGMETILSKWPATRPLS